MMINIAGIYFHLFEIPILVFLFVGVAYQIVKYRLRIEFSFKILIFLLIASLILYICAILLSVINAQDHMLVIKSAVKWFEVFILTILIFLYVNSDKHFRIIYWILFSACFFQILLVIFKLLSGEISVLFNRMFPGYESVFSFALLLPFIKSKNKILIFMLLIISLLSIIASLSRGAYIALILCLLYSYFAFPQQHKKKVIVVLFIFLIIFLASPADNILFKDFSITFSPTHGSNIERLVLIKFAFELFMQYPIFGAGSLNFPLYLFQHGVPAGIMSYDFDTLGPHNTFLQVASEEGLIGLFAFISILIAVYLLIKNFSRLKHFNKEYLLGLKLFAIVMFINLMLGFISSQLRFLAGLFLGLTIASFRCFTENNKKSGSE